MKDLTVYVLSYCLFKITLRKYPIWVILDKRVWFLTGNSEFLLRIRKLLRDSMLILSNLKFIWLEIFVHLTKKLIKELITFKFDLVSRNLGILYKSFRGNLFYLIWVDLYWINLGHRGYILEGVGLRLLNNATICFTILGLQLYTIQSSWPLIHFFFNLKLLHFSSSLSRGRTPAWWEWSHWWRVGLLWNLIVLRDNDPLSSCWWSATWDSLISYRYLGILRWYSCITFGFDHCWKSVVHHLIMRYLFCLIYDDILLRSNWKSFIRWVYSGLLN